MRSLLAAIVIASGTTVAMAQDDVVRITPDMERMTFTLDGDRLMTIERIQDKDHRLDTEFTKTSRPCPPFCIHPMKAADGVETVGEIELMAFIDSHVVTGSGLLVDSRIPAWFEKGTIPGAVNIPFSTVGPENSYRTEIFKALGAVENEDGTLDFTDALDLLLFCNGPWCDQSPTAINNMIAAGYPAEKLRYYRGGMQMWLMLGLTTATS